MSFIEIRFAESLNKVLAHSRRTFSRPGTRAGAGRLAQAQSRPRACRLRIAVAEPLGRYAQAQSGPIPSSRDAEGEHLSLQRSCQRPPSPNAGLQPLVPCAPGAVYLYRRASQAHIGQCRPVKPASCPAPGSLAPSARPQGQVAAPSPRPLRSQWGRASSRGSAACK